MNVNASALDAGDVPFAVVTVMSTGPAASAGDVATSCVLDRTVTEAAAVAPKETAVVVVKFEPVRVTLVPPVVGPLPGLTPVTVGPSMVSCPMAVPQSSPPVAVAYSPATQTSVGFVGSRAAPE